MLTAQLLQQNLMAKAASVAPSPDPEVQARYEQARRSLLEPTPGQREPRQTGVG